MAPCLLLNFSCQASWFGPSRQQRTTRPLCRPSPCWSGEENLKKKAKLVGRDKASLTGQQRKCTVTTTTLIERLYKTKQIHGAILSVPDAQGAPKQQFTSPRPAPPTGTQHDGTCCRIPCLAGLGQPTCLCPLLGSGENEPCPG